MQMSRSVITPATLPAASTTGTKPQSRSHMIGDAGEVCVRSTRRNVASS
jgi:hypothetical protein